MKHLYTFLEYKNWRAATKFRVFLLLEALIYGLAGFAVWGIVQLFALRSVEWMICFIGYPVIASWFLVFVYTINRDFTDGMPEL